MEVLYSRCAGLDVHKDTVVACLRTMVDGTAGRKVRTFKTTTKALLAVSEWMASEGCTHIAMEATGSQVQSDTSISITGRNGMIASPGLRRGRMTGKSDANRVSSRVHSITPARVRTGRTT
jgi:hypothetical protein